ncbi:hypothetical protein D4764_13G0012410 [Takifugu flavidus]|uniref:CCHC-type domain-containing protein n=1 Tax=Takifugu flavidus TaxID=433684 RepID=A0A5C6PC75_9TELE|nr:hypothetical protein D4764_13G0012410 [Takifugu flavidus]
MASSGMPSLSIRHGIRVQPDPSVPVEEVLLAVGDQVGHANLSYASRMNRGVVVFVKEERLVAELVGRGVTVNGAYLQVSPLATPSTRVTVSGVPPFVTNEALEQELQRFGKFASGLRTVGLGCRSDKLKHVLSLRRQCFMFLTCPSQTLDVSFRVRHGDGHYMVYASSGSMRCFECGDVGHKRVACPHRPANEGARTGAMSSRVAPPSGGGDEGAADVGGGPSGQVEEQGGGECVAAVRAGSEGAAEEVQMAGKAQAGATEEVEMGATEEVEMGATEEVKMGVNVQTGAAEEEQPGAQGVSGDQGQAAGEQLPDQPAEMLSVDEGGEEVMESDSNSDCGSIVDSQSLTGDLYTLEDITSFLDETFGQSVKAADFFPDPEKFLKSALMLHKAVGVDLLDERKRFRLKKHMTPTRKMLKQKGRKKVKTC